MTQRQLDRAVVRSTGESLRTIRRLGFSSSRPAVLEPEDLTLAVDCPFCGHPGPLSPSRFGPSLLAECPRCDVEFAVPPEDVYAAAAA